MTDLTKTAQSLTEQEQVLDANKLRIAREKKDVQVECLFFLVSFEFIGLLCRSCLI